MKENDIRSLKVVEEFFKNENVWTDGLLDSSGEIDKKHTVSINCPCCGKYDAKECLNKNAYHYVECSHCRTIFVNPRLKLEALHEYYATREERLKYCNVLADTDCSNKGIRKNNIFLPRKEIIENALLRCGKSLADSLLIDIGCATGQFLSVIEGHAKSITGVEAAPQLADIARESNPSAEIIPKPLEEAELPDNYFDVVTLWEVLEHAFDPKVFVGIVSRILKPNGLLFVSVPNIEGFDIQILWDKGNAFSAPSHLNYFRKSTVHYLFERCSLKLKEIVTPGKLDVDIVRNRINVHPDVQIRLGTYLSDMIKDESPEAEGKRKKLQAFISSAGLSSHMIVVCSK